MMRSDLGSVGTTSSLHSIAHTASALALLDLDELNNKFKSFPFLVSMIGFKRLQYLHVHENLMLEIDEKNR